MNAQTKDATLDFEYRTLVRDAAGEDRLAGMTEKCLASVEALVRSEPPPPSSPELIRELHRLAGGTAAVGLPALAASLRALEHGYEAAGEAASLEALWESCRGRAQDCRAVLPAESSCRSSR